MKDSFFLLNERFGSWLPWLLLVFAFIPYFHQPHPASSTSPEFYPPNLFPLPFCHFQSLLSEALPGGNPLSFDEFRSILPRRVRYSSSIPSTVVNSSPKIYKSIIGSISLSKTFTLFYHFLSFSRSSATLYYIT